MTEVLGYPRFGAYGGDVGSHVTNHLGAEHPQHVVGVYTHHPYLHPVVDDPATLSAAEQAYLAVPAGATLTPEDAAYPREFAERTYADLRQWRGPRSGGHFLPIEEPDALAADLRDFFRPLRAS